MDAYIPFVRDGGVLPSADGKFIVLVYSNGETSANVEDGEAPDQRAQTLDTADTKPDREKE